MRRSCSAISCLLPWALGQELRYAEGEGPLLQPIRDTAGLRALRPQAVAAAIAPVLEALRGLRGAKWVRRR